MGLEKRKGQTGLLSLIVRKSGHSIGDLGLL